MDKDLDRRLEREKQRLRSLLHEQQNLRRLRLRLQDSRNTLKVY